MKKILVTGAGGFIGSHLTELLVRRGFKVKAFVHYNANNHWGWLEHSSVKKDIEVVCGDVRDYDFVSKTVAGVDTVFHLAALIGIPYSYISPLAYIKTNVEGTYNIVESAKEEGVKNVIITSTSETYGTAQYVPIDEKHPSVGQSPYAASKIAADQIALSYYRSFGLPVKIVRPFNTYGPRQSARAIIPTIASQLISGATEIKLGNLKPTRDLTFVKDTAEGFLAIAACKALNGEVTNIGSNDEISVGDLAQKIAVILKKKIKISTDAKRLRLASSEVERLRCNHSKLVKATAWKPAYSLHQGLLETIAWMRKNKDLYKPGIYNV